MSAPGLDTPFDLCILGAGPAGYAAAMRAHDLGKRVLLVEKDRVGGAGIHCGALSSKTMWHLSNDFATAARTDRGYRAVGLELSYEAVLASVRAAVDERRATMEEQLHALTVTEPPRGSVTLLRGAGRVVSPHEVVVRETDGTERKIRTQFILLATGSVPRRPPNVDVDGDKIVTSDHIENWHAFPESMVVVGAGVVGCEYATIFANFGRTKINIIDRQPRILPFEDEDVSEVVASAFAAAGITHHRESTLEEMRVKDGMVEYILCTPEGVCSPIRVERALISVGRVPNTKGLGLETVGVALDKAGGVVVTDTQSNIPTIFAAGDTSMDVALVNVAELEGRHAVERMFGREPRPIHYEALSAIMFLSPEVASVGLNELAARKQGIPYKVGVVTNRLINRNIAMRETGGFIKLLAARDGSEKILGMRVVGPQASSAIQGIAFLIDQGASLEDIDRCVHPHPAITEGVQECARLLLGRSIHKHAVLGPRLLRLGEG
jgi:dihydrolipoamide dehydrogenase